MAERDPYEVLGVKRSADTDTIRNAYRKLAKKNHPDLNPGNKAAEKAFKEINSAYELLSDEKKRARFDRGEIDASGQEKPRGPFYSQTQEEGGRYTYSNDFGPDFFGEFFRRAGPIPGQDHQYRMEIEFPEAALGASKTVTLQNGKTLEVKIPPGIDTGARLRFRGQGGPGMGGGPAGDAIVEITVRPSTTFVRHGRDLEIEVPVSLYEAVLGGEIPVQTLEGQVLLKIPKHVNSGTRLRIRGRGIPGRGGEARGDQYAVLKIMLPPQMDSELEEAIRRSAEQHPFNPRQAA